MLVILGFALLALGYAFWSFLALVGGLPAFGVVLLVEAFGFLALGVGWGRLPARTRAGLLAACALLEGAGLLLVPLSTVAILLNLLVVAGLALAAWRASLAPGAFVAAAGMGLMLASSLLGGEAFLLPGYVLAAAGWGVLSWRALRAPAAHASAESAA